MILASGGPIRGSFWVRDAAGENTAADSLPTAVVTLDGDADAASVTITDKTGGQYKFSATGPTATAGQVVEVHATVTVDGVTQSDVVYRAVVQPSVAVADKTGFSLASTGLDAIVPSEPAGEVQFGTSTLPEHIAVQSVPITNKRTFTVTSSTAGTIAIRNNADDANLWTHACTDDGTTSTIGKAT